MSSEGYKVIYLESHGYPQAITPQAYEQIKAIIQAHLICTYCLKGYTPDNPQVAENVCVRCFLKRRTSPTNLTFVGEVPSAYAKQYGYQIFTFKDAQGYVYLTNSHNKLNDSLERDIHATLVHYGYRVPDRYTLLSGTEVALHNNSWRMIYGDFHSSPVLLATYHEYYGNHLATAFLLYRDREPLESSKRKNPTRRWYLETKAAIAATYTPTHGYVVSTGQDSEDRTAYQLYDSHFYPGILARAVAAYEKRKDEVVPPE